MATPASARAAHELGGGGGVAFPSSAPATVTTRVARPPSSRNACSGIVGPHSIVKWGSTILSARGRLSQIWNSSAGLPASRSRSGNISAWTIPRPAVIHWTSPWPKRAVAPSESEWSMKPAAGEGHGLEAAVGVAREARHHVAVVHPPAVLALEVHADLAAGERRGRPHGLVAGGVEVEVVDTEEEGVERLPGEAQREDLLDGGMAHLDLGKPDSIPGYHRGL